MKRIGAAYGYAGAAVLFWATIPTAFKIALAQADILPLLTVASTTSAAVLLAVVVARKKTGLLKASTRAQWIHSALLGLINPAVYYLVLLKAYALLPGQVAQPLNMIWPIVLVFISVPILGQKIEARSYLALVVSFVGVCVISSQGRLLGPDGTDLAGVLLATGSSILWAVYFILNVKDDRDEAVKLALNFIFGSAYLAAWTTLAGQWGAPLNRTALAASVYIGLFEMGIAFLFWLRALQLAPTTAVVSHLVYLAPFLSLVFLRLVIHEPLCPTTPAGLVLIIAGILIQNRRAKKPAGSSRAAAGRGKGRP